MFVLSLCKQLCPDKLPVVPDQRLGEGADGEVFTIVDDPTKVLKLGILYEYGKIKLSKAYGNIDRALEYMIQTQPSAYVRVYRHGSMGVYSRDNVAFRKGKQSFVIYYYIMEKLEKISEDERRVFHSILSHEDSGIEKNYSSTKIKEMLQGMRRSLDFDEEKVTLFCDNIKSVPVYHLDIHVRNIMKDRDGNFKLIDLDRIELEKENDKY